jgi:ubiquinone/menaquinone biosynthesis C-methylase UbiE
VDAVRDREAGRQRWELAAATADAYERYLVPALFAPWAERLVELAAPAPGERLLDLACGTGIVARRAAARVGAGGAATGLDRNPEMLRVAEAAAAGMSPPVRWLAGDAADLPFPDGAFDLACCQQGLQFFPDREGVLEELRRVLVPGGRLTLAVWRDLRHCPGFRALAEALERHAGAEVAATMRAPFAAGDAGALRQLVSGAGFGGVRVRIAIGEVAFPSVEEFLRRQAAASPLAGPVAALEEGRRAALLADLDERLAAHRDDTGVVFPIEATLLTAHAPAA